MYVSLHLVLYCLVVKSSCGSGVIGDDINDASSILATFVQIISEHISLT